MDGERVQRIKLQAREALDDLSPAGILGWSAMTDCARATTLIDGLSATNAADTLIELRAIVSRMTRSRSDLDAQENAAFDSAFDRVHLVAKVAAEALQSGGAIRVRSERANAEQFLSDVARQGIASIELVEWTLTDEDEIALRASAGFRYCPAVDIALGAGGDRWRFSGHESAGTLQLNRNPASPVDTGTANAETTERLDDYRGLTVQSAGFGCTDDHSVVSLEIRFDGAENLYLFACEFDDDDPQRLSVGEEVVVLCTSRAQAERVGLIHRASDLGDARFADG